MSAPNIIFYFSDQQRWDTMGCYGQRLPVTPNLDRLAKEGTRFEYAFTCQPVCGPARACLQSGLYATQVGCHTNHRILPEGMDSYPFVQEGIKRGVYCVPGVAFAADASQISNGFRMNYSTPSDEQIVKGVDILGKLSYEWLEK
jgi:hypothetical protein